MAYRANHLPSRFPVGTKFVIEGRPGGKGQLQVFSRHLEFPDGTRVQLPKQPARRTPINAKSPSVPRSRVRRSASRTH